MLEAKLEELTRAVERLTAAVEGATLNPAQRQAVEAAAASASTVVDTGDTADIPLDEPIQEIEPVPAPSRKELRDMCLALVRADGANKPKVKAAIKAHGGTLIEDVPEENMSDLKAALEAF